MADVLYLCNGKRCPNSYSCKVQHPKNGICSHTTNTEYAMFEICDDPDKYPKRFMKCCKDNGDIYYEEREVYS